MATKVYLSGKNIIVDQTGTALLTIRTDRAMNITLIPFESDNGTTPVPIYIEFKDTFYQTTVTEKILEVQNQAGTAFASHFLLMEYLNGFFPRSSSRVIFSEGASSENQEIIIAQNEVIKTNTSDAAKELRQLENIKDEAQTNNKLLGKIYNQE
jgi:hypothetical protein